MLVLGALGLLPFAHPETSLEHQAINEPSPHERLVTPLEKVPVHWARYVERLGDDAHRAQSLDDLRQTVGQCARFNREEGKPVAHIKAWPDAVSSVRKDVYLAADRVAVYSHGMAYGLDPKDCSLFEHETRAVKVSGLRGSCHVDLIAQTATGVCEGLQGPAARPRPAPQATRPPGIPSPVLPSPLVPRLTGERRMVAGVACDVASNHLDPDGGTRCHARGGSFAGHGPHVSADGTGLIVEARSPRGFVFQADRVILDMAVPSVLFAPEHAAGVRFLKDQE